MPERPEPIHTDTRRGISLSPFTAPADRRECTGSSGAFEPHVTASEPRESPRFDARRAGSAEVQQHGSFPAAHPVGNRAKKDA